MGLVLVIVIGAMLGWLASLVVDRGGRAGTLVCILAGVAGSLVAAYLSGDVALVIGVSATQLSWAVLGAMLAIVTINTVVVTRPVSWGGNFDKPTGQRHHRPRPF